MALWTVVIVEKCNAHIRTEKVHLQTFFLKKDNDGHFHLNVKHSYYYQVQAQIKLCSVEYCDLVL